MVELLAAEKRRLLAANGHVTSEDFEAAWAACWTRMILDHAFPHKTSQRRGWRQAMWATRSETRAAFLNDSTAFSEAVERLTRAAARSRITLSTDDLPRTMITAYVTARDDDEIEIVAAAA